VDERTPPPPGAVHLTTAPALPPRAVHVTTAPEPSPVFPALLTADHLSVGYDATSALTLHALSMTLLAGERVALLGANGSGKTTCLLALAGLLPPRQGRLLLEGAAWDGSAAMRRRWRSRVGLVLADPDDQLLAPIVRDDLAFGVRNAGLDEATVRARVSAVMRALALEALADRAVDSLSLGERKRVAIAGVLVMEPAILLLDEPSANLDRRGREGLYELLTQAAQGNRAVCLTTHDTRFALRWADRVIILDGGRVLATGAPHALLHDRALLDRAWLDHPAGDSPGA
jgi:cobalt/nickel transport system ATP-binding protein